MKLLSAILGILILASTCPADDDAVQAEFKKLEGTWQLVSSTKNGVDTPEDVIKKVRVAIKPGSHTVYFGDDVIAHEIKFTIDLTTTPKSTTDTLPDGKLIKGIYKLDGDTLTSCVGETDKDRPKEFDAKAGTDQTLRVFKRVKATQ